MKCNLCGGLVIWKGPLTNLTHTECQSCGAINSQEVEMVSEEEQEGNARMQRMQKMQRTLTREEVG